MNGKQAKRLRRAALGLAVTLEQSGKKIDKEGYRTIVHDDAARRTQVVRRDTLKGIYKNLKSGLK